VCYSVRWRLLEDRLCLLVVLNVMRRVLCMLSAVEGELCLLEVIHRVLLGMLSAVEV